MPTVYVRKGNKRASWTEESLQEAIAKVREGQKVLAVAKLYGIPRTTLQNRLKSGITSKGSLGPPSQLGAEVEMKIVNHIKKLQARGFAPDRRAVREMAFRIAQALQIKTSFSEDTGLAGFPWFNSFMRRNPSLRIRQAEGVSKARATGLNKKDVSDYFDLLYFTMEKFDLLGKPCNIYNMDETGLSLNNKPGKVVAAKGSKNVPSLTSGERGETITVVTSCNAEGTFLPPYCIFKGKNRKEEWLDGMPPGSDYAMSAKSAYVNSEIFKEWLTSHFIPRKPVGKVLLILDGHKSHTNDVLMLEFAEENDIILLGFPSHTTHFLQPLDRSFFKSLKSHWNCVCNTFMRNNPARKINRAVFGQLLGQAWNKAATVETGANGFKATGIHPLNRDAIPDYAFLGDDGTNEDISRTVDSESNMTNLCIQSRAVPVTSSGIDSEENLPISGSQSVSMQLTPAKLLMNISPIPSVMTGQAEKQRVCVKQLAKIFNSDQSIKELKDKALKKEMRQKELEERKRKRAFNKEIKQKEIEEKERDRTLKREIKEKQAMEKGNKEKKRRRKLSYEYDESECDEAISLHDDSTDEWVEEVEEVKEDEPKELQEGTFVVVRVSGKKAYRLFVAKIICKSSEGLEVKFYKRVEKLMKFKETDETNYADEEDVVIVLSKPIETSSARYQNMIGFSNDLSEFCNVLG